MKIKKEFQKMIRYRFLLLLVAGFVMGQNALAQEAAEFTASGTVKEAATGEPLGGVTVTVEGTGTKAITNLDGEFTISAPEGSMLQFSYMGLESQTMKAATAMNIVLQEPKDDDAIVTRQVEVVAIGYGNARKEDLTGSITGVSADELKKGVITSPTQLLQSKVAGLTVVQSSGDPTSGAMMRLRGGSSLSGNNDPLVVVDGIADVDPNTVQPSDIISIDILKDASASAIYGSRGANGVILITTRRKAENNDDCKMTVSGDYNGYFSVAQASKQLNLLTADNWDTHSTPEATVTNYGGNTNWQDQIQQTALTHSHAVTFSGASNKTGFKGSISYLNSEGVIKTSQMERIGASVSGYTKLWDNRLTLEAGIHTNRDNYSNIDYTKVFHSAYGLNPTLPVKLPTGEYAQQYGNSTYLNPIEYFNNRTDDKTRNRFLTFAKADLRIIQGLNLNVNLARNHQITDEREYINRGAREIEIDENRFGAGRAMRSTSDWAEQQIEAFLTYDKTIKKQHKLNVMAGGSYSVAIAEGMGGRVWGFEFDDFSYNNLEAGTTREYLYSYKNKTQLLSYFGRVNYSYNSRYMLTATLRADGSSKFGKNNKWGIFPSGSAAWRITQEKFMSGARHWLNDLKLRVGYGVTGNQGQIDPYSSMKLWSTSKSTADIYRPLDPVIVYDDEGNATGQRVPIINYQNENPDLKWESTSQLNVGLDFELFKSRLSGTIEFYHKNTKDLLYFYKLPASGTVFYPNQLLNIGNMTNTGVELTLNGIIAKGNDYTLSANLNLAHNANEIQKLTDPRFVGTRFEAGFLDKDGAPLTGATNAYTQELREGYSIGSFFGAKYYGKDENGNFLYEKTLDGVLIVTDKIEEADRVYLGNAMPKLTLGFGLNFTYKGFDASINTYGMFGQKVFNATRMDLYSADGREAYNVMSDWATGKQNIEISDYWIEDGSFFRLQNLTVGYTFNLKKIKMNSLRVYLTAENLFVLTAYTGVDPEVGIDMNVTEEVDRNKVFPGIDFYNNYPKPRNFIVGLNLKF